MATQMSTHEIAERATEFYDRELRTQLESSHRDEFVAIEPVSSTWYLGKSLRDVRRLARQAFPDRTAFAIRIGHAAAVHIGGFNA